MLSSRVIRTFVILTLPLFFVLATGNSIAQDITQTVRGTVVDSESKFPLPGVNVVLLTDQDDDFQGTSTDVNGQFRVENIPVGRQVVKFTYTGYKDVLLNNVIVSSAKEVVLEVEMEESVQQLESVEIKATRSGEVNNEMAMVSARQFSVDETDRYPGSRGDPSRMASNFAGVQGADDSRNDIVIRGNSPSGILWQVEGIPIPNPNHFNIPGTAGGPVNIINNKVLANSDFYTGAFPAEFGNGIAGVFDIRYRSGNNQQYEFSSQLGFLGLELAAEGPINKEKGSSFLATYRYSTLTLFQALDINIGVDAVPNYQDLNFKLNFPQENGATWSVWGLGGTSTIDIILSEDIGSSTIYGSSDRDQYFTTRMGVLGSSYTLPINKDTFFKVVVAASHEQIEANHDLILTRDSTLNGETRPVLDGLEPILDYSFSTNKLSAHAFMFKKLSSRTTLNYGVQADRYDFNMIDSAVNIAEPIEFDTWETRWNSDESAYLAQPYIQLKHRFNERLELTSGLRMVYFSLGNSLSPVEPRLGLRYQLRNQSNLSFGMGIHSQIQQPYLHFYSDSVNMAGEQVLYNEDMDFTYSGHLVGGYEKWLGTATRIKLEAYYQRLWNIPVEVQPSSFSLINQGSGFSRFFPTDLTNEGTGFNYGLEVTLEKFFSKQFFFLLTGALFEAKYRGSDGVLRDSDFNGNYAFNALAAYEHPFTKTKSLTLGFNLTYVGGRRTGPVDGSASAALNELVFVDDLRNSEQFPDYFRPDLRISYKSNRRRVTHEIAIDLTNFIGRQNVLARSYIREAPFFRTDYQLGFFPIFYYKIDF